MAGGSKLALKQDPVLALAFGAMLLAFSREKIDQAMLAEKDALTVLGLVLEVPSSCCSGAHSMHSGCFGSSSSADFQIYANCV